MAQDAVRHNSASVDTPLSRSTGPNGSSDMSYVSTASVDSGPDEMAEIPELGRFAPGFHICKRWSKFRLCWRTPGLSLMSLRAFPRMCCNICPLNPFLITDLSLHARRGTLLDVRECMIQVLLHDSRWLGDGWQGECTCGPRG